MAARSERADQCVKQRDGLSRVPGAFTRASALGDALRTGTSLNAAMLAERLRGRKSLVFQINAATQFMHIEPVLKELVRRGWCEKAAIWVLTASGEMPGVGLLARSLAGDIRVASRRAARLLMFCDCVISVDQGAMFPRIGCPVRACCFHGQPSKGNTYSAFNYAQINTLFFYGPLMRDYYLRSRSAHPEWPQVRYHEVGQPLSDRRVNRSMSPIEARTRLGLATDRLTVLYAPSFEYCSSMATHGPAIIDALLNADVNLIVKPHPAFYNTVPFDDPFNRDVPNIRSWRERVVAWNGQPGVVFRDDNALDAEVALAASDVMVSDYSGIAFDGIQADLGMVYWECPSFYDDYLPRRYGIDGADAKLDLACNVGRDAGEVVSTLSGLSGAIETYRGDPSHRAADRRRIREQLLFNPGGATGAMADTIETLLFEAH